MFVCREGIYSIRLKTDRQKQGAVAKVSLKGDFQQLFLYLRTKYRDEKVTL